MSQLIYVADDEKNIRNLIKMFLENEGYRVKTFSNGYSVSEALKLQMPDLVILDIMMPGEDGLSICANLRKKSDVPIIIISAKDTPLDRVLLDIRLNSAVPHFLILFRYSIFFKEISH